MNEWINVDALWHVLVFGLLVGAGLPVLFALGVRAQAAGGAHDDAPSTAASGVAYAVYAVVLLVAVLGVLFVARDFIGHHTGVYLLGAEPK